MSDLAALAGRAVERLLARGANEAAAVVSRDWSVEVTVRARQVEKVQESASATMSVAVYADGRYSSHSTCDLRPGALERFLDNAVALTRVLEPDPFRKLPDPKLYEGRPAVDLGLVDPRQATLETAERKRLALEAEEAAIAAAGEACQSVTVSFADGWGETVRVASNGFCDREEGTSFSSVARVTVKDGDRRPEDYWYGGARTLADLPAAATIGRRAAARALGRIGARKVAGGAMTVLVENLAAGRLLGFLLQAASGAALQQKRSFLDGRLGETIASERLTIVDDPLIPGALGSRRWDGEGISARRLPIVEAGALRAFFIDTYYARKLGVEPTTGASSNLVIPPGARDLAAIERSIERGIVVTSFLGGNSNSLTGDFSTGIQGWLIEKGARVHPVGEMNLSGNHRDFWMRLVEVGADPWPYSSVRSPSLLFEAVSVSGA